MTRFLIAAAGAALAAVCAGSAWAGTPYAGRFISSGEDSWVAFPGDLDADGDVDLVSSAPDLVGPGGGLGEGLFWYQNNGADVPTFTARRIDDIESVTSIFVADIDGDGDLDIVTNETILDELRLYVNDGSPTPSFSRRVFATADSPRDVVCVDLNDDGMVDIVSSIGDEILWLQNIGGSGPRFAIRTVGSGVSEAAGLAVDDFNGDGAIDVGVASFGGDRVVWFESDGADVPSFTARTAATSVVAATSIVSADFDGDGDVDLAAMDDDLKEIRLLRNDGADPPTFLVQTIAINVDPPTLLTPRSLFAADLEGDGDVDMLAADVERERVVLLENNGAGGFSTFQLTTAALSPDLPFGVTAADMDADGVAEVVLSNAASVAPGSLVLLDPALAGVENETTGVGSSTISSAIAFASDGDTLAAFGERFGAEPVIDFGSKPLTLRSRGGIEQPAGGLYTPESGSTLATSPARTLRWGAAEIPLAISADAMSLEGRVLIRGGGTTSFETAALRLGPAGEMRLPSTSGVFVAATRDISIAGDLVVEPNAGFVGVGPTTLGREATFSSRSLESSGPRDLASLETADVDGDGDIDLLTADRESFEVRWHENDGATPASFTERTIFSSAFFVEPASIRNADLDGDGDVDVATSWPLEGVIRWHENDGSGGFLTRTVFAGAPGARSVVPGDIDGDGDTDLVSGSSDDDSIRWHENDGASPPGFTTRVISVVDAFVTQVFVVDVDGDGDVDVLSAATSGGAAWHENLGGSPPSFQRRIILDGSFAPRSVFGVDMDRDGDVDVLSASLIDDTIRWHENDGGTPPSFSAREISSEAGDPVSVIGVDLDEDGDVDAVSADADLATRGIRWYDNDGTQSFRARTVLEGAGQVMAVRGVTSADIDGDGDIDLVSAAASLGDRDGPWVHENALLGGSTSIGAGSQLGAQRLVNARSLSLDRAVIASAEGFLNTGSLSGDGALDTDVVNDREMFFSGDTLLRGDLTNNGVTTIDSGDVLTVTGSVVNNGVIVGEFVSGSPVTERGAGGPEVLVVEGDLASARGSTLRVETPDGVVRVEGAWDIGIDEPGAFDLATAEVRLEGTSGVQTVERMSRDVGASAAGLDPDGPGSFPIGTLRVAAGATAQMVDARDNDGMGQGAGEALYVRTLVIEAGGTLLTNGSPVYYVFLVNDGAVDDPANLVRVDPCPADLTGDDVVGVSDLSLLLSQWGGLGGGGSADFDGDDEVDSVDLSLLLGAWGVCP